MDAKCASPKFIQEGQPRLRYDRDVILSLKERVLSSDTEALYHVDLNEVAQRSTRGKPTKQVASGRNQPDRSRDTKSIVLGPQKRTWNTGCHVAPSGSREMVDATGRPGRAGSEYRMGERHSKSSMEHKREYRNGTRVSNRRTDGSFCSSYPDKEYKYHHSEEEPEWFSGGPSTVSETIELGGIVEGDGDCTPDNKAQSPIVDNATEKVVTLQSLCASLSPCKLNQSSDSVSPQKDLSKTEEPPVLTGNAGSRFKHLFNATDADAERDKVENINQQLLRLLKGSANAKPVEQYKNNVIQVENKLRSLLLGHRLSAASNNRPIEDVETKEKPKVLTVEEIEAQLSQSSASSQAPLETGGNSAHESPTHQLVSTTTQATDMPCRQNPLDSSLASVLQSLASKHQAACSRSTPVHGAFRSLGIFQNPVVRLPTNALSASARINQLQQPELGTMSSNDPATSMTNVTISNCSGVLGHMLDNSADTALPRTGQNQPHLLSSRPGLISGANPEPVTKPASAGLNALPLNLPVPRRPIVKSQLGPNSLTSQKHSLGSAEMDRSLSNIPTGQPTLANNEKLFYNHVFPNAYNLPSNFHEATNISVASTNNNSYFQQRPFCDRPQSENTLEFLSHLVEMDRSSVSLGHRKPAASLNPLLPVALRAKTLEELERQEVLHTDTFL